MKLLLFTSGNSFLISALPKGDDAYLFVFLLKKKVFFLTSNVITYRGVCFFDLF